MTVDINNEIGYTELSIEVAVIYQETYQMNMLRECDIEGVLPVVAYGEDDISRYIYDVTGMQSMWNKYDRELLSGGEIREFSKQLLSVLKGVKQHMLDVNKLMIDPKYIYKKEGKYYFCYYPLYSQEIQEGFHLLSEYFVKVIDYDDIETVRLVGNMHKQTMDEQYDISSLLQTYCVVEYSVNNVDERVKEQVNHSQQKSDVKEDIWAQEIKDNGEFQNSSVDSTKESSFKYKVPKESQFVSVLKESSVAKWWGQKNMPSQDKGEKANVKKIKNSKKSVWGEWDDLLQEKM